MNIYQLKIREANLQAHLDLENEISLKGNGLLTFTIRVNNGNIADLNTTEYVNPNEKYAVVKTIVIEELYITPDNGVRSLPDPVRDDNL